MKAIAEHRDTDSITVLLEAGERQMIILAIEQFLGNNDDFYHRPDEHESYADYVVFVEAYNGLLKLYFAFTNRDFVCGHGVLSNRGVPIDNPW